MRSSQRPTRNEAVPLHTLPREHLRAVGRVGAEGAGVGGSFSAQDCPRPLPAARKCSRGEGSPQPLIDFWDESQSVSDYAASDRPAAASALAWRLATRSTENCSIASLNSR